MQQCNNNKKKITRNCCMQRQTYTLAQLSHRYMFESKEKNAFAWFFFGWSVFFVSFCSFPCWEIDWSCIVRAVKCRKLDEMKSVFEIEIEHNKLASQSRKLFESSDVVAAICRLLGQLFVIYLLYSPKSRVEWLSLGTNYESLDHVRYEIMTNVIFDWLASIPFYQMLGKLMISS